MNRRFNGTVCINTGLTARYVSTQYRNPVSCKCVSMKRAALYHSTGATARSVMEFTSVLIGSCTVDTRLVCTAASDWS